MNTEHVNVSAHPAPVVLQPAKNVLHSLSEVALVLSVHAIGLQAESPQMQAFYVSVVAAGPQAYFGYVEQAPFVMHPAPLVVHVEIIALQSPSVFNFAGSNSQVKGTHIL